jgi:acetyl-CoA C-acetyltransferase
LSTAARTPVIIGVAQKTVRPDERPGPEPLDAWREVAIAASADAGLGPEILKRLDFLAVADCFTYAYDRPVDRLADELGAAPEIRFPSPASGTAGQVMLDQAMAAIREGRAETALLVGGEAMATRRALTRDGGELGWRHPLPQGESPGVDLTEVQHPGEVATGMMDGIGAVYTFAMRDIARRAHLGITPEAYRQRLGGLMSGLTRVAAGNPDAWFPTERDPSFLIEPRPDNRYIAYPYTKHMVAIMDVDISAAILLTSEAHADELGVPADGRIYPWVMAYVNDPVFTAVRPDLWRSPGMHTAARAVLDAAGVTADDLGYIDLYSCFPAALNFAADALGLEEPTGERLSLTGGLPYGGGPGSSYMLTSVGKMVRKLRADRDAVGLVSGVGMMMTNHAWGLYSATRPPETLAPLDSTALQRELDAIPEVPVTEGYEGWVSVATYTVMYNRRGEPTHGAAIADLPDGSRAYARILDPVLLDEALRTELVGRALWLKAGVGAGELCRTQS